MPTVTQAVRRFFIAQKATHNGPDLLERYLALDGMETQINVHRGDGEPVDGKANTYSDSVRKWGPIRIPWKANSVPEWPDYHLSWPLHEYVDAIGSSGWNYKTRTSHWCAFDFDGMTHRAGLNEQQLRERCRTRMQGLQDEIDALKAKLVDVREPLRAARADVVSRAAALEIARETLSGAANGPKKAEALRSVIDRIVCKFRPTPSKGNGGKGSLDSVEIQAVSGDVLNVVTNSITPAQD